MEIMDIGVGTRIKMLGLRHKGLIEISQEPSDGNFVLIVSKGLKDKWYQKWLRVNLPEQMWKVTCSRDEVLDALSKLVGEQILS